jgi:hypothetical protein
MLNPRYVGSRAHCADCGTVGPHAGPEMNRACQCSAQSARLVDMGQSNITRVTWDGSGEQGREGLAGEHRQVSCKVSCTAVSETDRWSRQECSPCGCRCHGPLRLDLWYIFSLDALAREQYSFFQHAPSLASCLLKGCTRDYTS